MGENGSRLSFFEALDAFMLRVNPSMRGFLGLVSLILAIFSMGVIAGSFFLKGRLDDTIIRVERMETDIRMLNSDKLEWERRLRSVELIVCVQVEGVPAQVCTRR